MSHSGAIGLPFRHFASQCGGGEAQDILAQERLVRIEAYDRAGADGLLERIILFCKRKVRNFKFGF